MIQEFPGAVPEIPVINVDEAAAYYREKLGFNVDWGNDEGGIGGISRGQCRMLLTNRAFRETRANSGPLVIWLNLNNREEVNELHQQWSATGAKILSSPEAKPWKLHEFTAADLDGNLFRVFYDFGWETR